MSFTLDVARPLVRPGAPAEAIAPGRPADAPPGRLARDLLELTKPRIGVLVLASVGLGYHLAAIGAEPAASLLATLLGMALISGGASAFNMVLERQSDGAMARTASRPIPAGRVSAAGASLFGAALSAGGLAVLWLWTTPLAAALAAAAWVSYVAVYTPLKRWSSLCTIAGAVPGALPPVVGWAAARGALSVEPWILFAIIFLWQLPHFLAIAWLYRGEYARAGMPMLPVLDGGGRMTGRQALHWAAMLVPVSLLPAFLGMAGTAYLVTAALLNLAYCGASARLLLRRDHRTARWLFLVSIAYLPALLLALALDARPLGG